MQYNYMDEEYQAGTRGLKYAADKGLAVVVMEPIRGGQLSRSPPQEIMDLWNASHMKRAPADWALQWVWNRPEVSVVLSGMSTMDHVTQNIMSAQHSGANTLTADELALVERVKDKYLNLTPIPCTKCEYCMPCASGVKIPEIFELYNEAMMYNDIEYARRVYTNFFKEEERADKCTKDRECEEKCPQGIKVSEWMMKIHKCLIED
jgi:predicted aldo/keto reductase-like oxidoreductase